MLIHRIVPATKALAVVEPSGQGSGASLGVRDAPKNRITPARTYRSLNRRFGIFLLYFALSSLPLAAAVLFFYPEISQVFSQAAVWVLQQVPVSDARVFSEEFIPSIGPIHFVLVPGRYPTVLFAQLNLIVTAVLLLLLLFIVKIRPSTIFAVIALFVHLVSSLFFVLFPLSFPYTAFEYSHLYVLQQILLWLFIPIAFGSSIALLPCSLPFAIAANLVICLYSLAFAFFRYVAFLYVLSRVSIIYMPSMFFTFGPFTDFLYVVCLYSLVVCRVSRGITRRSEIWQW